MPLLIVQLGRLSSIKRHHILTKQPGTPGSAPEVMDRPFAGPKVPEATRTRGDGNHSPKGGLDRMDFGQVRGQAIPGNESPPTNAAGKLFILCGRRCRRARRFAVLPAAARRSTAGDGSSHGRPHNAGPGGRVPGKESPRHQIHQWVGQLTEAFDRLGMQPHAIKGNGISPAGRVPFVGLDKRHEGRGARRRNRLR